MTYVDPNTCWDEPDNFCDRCDAPLIASQGALCDPCHRATYGGGR